MKQTNQQLNLIFAIYISGFVSIFHFFFFFANVDAFLIVILNFLKNGFWLMDCFKRFKTQFAQQ